LGCRHHTEHHDEAHEDPVAHCVGGHTYRRAQVDWRTRRRRKRLGQRERDETRRTSSEHADQHENRPPRNELDQGPAARLTVPMVLMQAGIMLIVWQSVLAFNKESLRAIKRILPGALALIAC
jgi:hypothetical protein